MRPEYAKAFELLEKLASQLGTTADFLWKTLVAQAHVYAIYWGIQALIVLVLVAIYIKSLVGTFKTELSKDSYDHDRLRNKWEKWDGVGCLPGMLAIFILTGIPLLGMCIWLIVEISRVVTAVVNPNFWALQKLLAMLAGGCK
jgi:hypothetical protein